MNADALPLRDIHLPEPVSWWPPAIGWWLLLALICACITGIAVWRRRAAKLRTAPTTLARAELARVRANWAENRDPERLAAAASTWLRRAGMSVTSRRRAAGLTGAQWLQFLDELAGDQVFSGPEGELLTTHPYRPAAADPVQIDGDRVLLLCERWLDSVSRMEQSR